MASFVDRLKGGNLEWITTICIDIFNQIVFNRLILLLESI